MKTLNTLIRISIMLMLALLVVSCVGTVKDANPKQTNILNNASDAPFISFDGLIKAEAISHDKIELQFSPANSAGDIIYEIYVNNSPIPIKINGKSLTLNANGNHFFTVTGLQINTTYSFNIRATVAGFASDSKLDPDKSLFATTFNNQTADFLGVAAIQLGAGESGRDTIIVKWNPATITGTSINPKETDPVQYEITYISQLGGAANLNNANYAGPDRQVVYSPASLNNPPALNKEKQYTISGLTPGVTYYAQVRAIHKGFITYGSDPLYKREKNTRFLKMTTYASAGVFDFNSTQVVMAHPLGELGLTNLDVSWLPASGEFYNYRLCYKKVAGANGSAPANDLLTDSDIDAVLNDPAYCVLVAANQSTYRLASLESYAYYQAKVIACKNATCGSSERIKSTLLQGRVVTNIAQFSGITNISNPLDDTKLDEVKATFDAPVVSSGYITRMKFYCYSSATDPSPVILPTDGSFSSGTGKTNCNGIATDTTFPTSLDEFSSFNNIKIKFQNPIDGLRTYCLSLVPTIESNYLNQENLTSAVIKCFTPEIKTPNNTQFPGKNPMCTTNAGKDLSITWPTPTGGLYSKFVIFYKEKNSGTDFFSYTDAVNAYTANNAASAYKWVDDIDKALISYNILNLIPGKSYSIGILPYLVNGATNLYGQFNLNVDECSLPLPQATFQEWVDIFAIGPKEDGLTPPTGSGLRKYLLETLDDDGIPVEMKIQSDEKSPDTNDALAAARTSSTYLDGVYGALDAKDTNPLNQYSNNGIVKIAWKDVSFFSGTTKMSDYITSLETTPNTKSSRLYGYRVYRSDDNQTSWVDLTTKSAKNKFQSTFNAGLIHPKSFTWQVRNNAASVSEKIVFFTDYSAKFSGVSEEIDRARTYWYKIVPVFDGKEIGYLSGKNPSHHVIRVTLPPRNMALVHRMMANRTVCLEMDKTLNKAEGEHYSCDYNGLGASGKNATPSVGSTVYDLGGDLLIDRFELSCPFTRGDSNYTNSDSSWSGTRTNFTGYSDYGNSFKGCFNEKANEYEPNQGSFIPLLNYKSKQVTPGDCFGRETGTTTAIGSVACTDPGKVNTARYIYPGVHNGDWSPNCTDTNFLGDNMFNLSDPNSKINTDNASYFPTQSEYAAVYYMRSLWNVFDGSITTPRNPPAANGRSLQNKTGYEYPSSCQVNLGYVNSSGKYRPRWIPVNWLINKIGLDNASTTMSLYNKSIGQILTDPTLYDSNTVIAPSVDLITNNRYSSTTTLSRVVTSNAAKLPGLVGLGQLDFSKLCSTYKIQVGIENSTKGFMPLNDIQSKRLMRRKENTVAAAWPSHYDQTKVSSVENGTYMENSEYKGCNSANRVAAMGTSSYQKGDAITPVFPNAGKNNTFLMEGSSSVDSASINTEKCVSRFGVQDLAGNLGEVNSDEIHCDYTQDKLFLGVPNSIALSVPYSGGYYNPDNGFSAWLLKQPQSGSCSVVEAGGSRTGNYVTGASFTPIYNYLGLNTSVVSKAKRFDQDAVLSSRNGDGSFLDFGQMNLGPRLDSTNSLSMTSAASTSNYFNPVLGIPLVCGAGCDGNASDNALITSTTIAAAKGYDASNNPLNLSILDFPVNNSVISNVGISEIGNYGGLSTTYPDNPAVNYINGINTGTNPDDPADNYFEMLTYIPGSGTPASLISTGFNVSRIATLKMYSGGSSTSNAGRFSLHISGYTDDSERAISVEVGSRCSVMINQD